MKVSSSTAFTCRYLNKGKIPIKYRNLIVSDDHHHFPRKFRFLSQYKIFADHRMGWKYFVSQVIKKTGFLCWRKKGFVDIKIGDPIVQKWKEINLAKLNYILFALNWKKVHSNYKLCLILPSYLPSVPLWHTHYTLPDALIMKSFIFSN